MKIIIKVHNTYVRNWYIIMHLADKYFFWVFKNSKSKYILLKPSGCVLFLYRCEDVYPYKSSYLKASYLDWYGVFNFPLFVAKEWRDCTLFLVLHTRIESLPQGPLLYKMQVTYFWGNFIAPRRLEWLFCKCIDCWIPNFT